MVIQTTVVIYRRIFVSSLSVGYVKYILPKDLVDEHYEEQYHLKMLPTFVPDGNGRVIHQGNLNVAEYPSLHSLPDNLTVDGNLDVDGSNVHILPDNLIVKGHLFSGDLRAYPDNLTLNNKFVVLSNVGVETLGKNFHVKGTLTLDGSRVGTLPRGLKVDKTLYLENRAVPAGLSVGDDLFLTLPEETLMLPGDISVKGSIFNNNKTLSADEIKAAQERYVWRTSGREVTDVVTSRGVKLVETSPDMHSR